LVFAAALLAGLLDFADDGLPLLEPFLEPFLDLDADVGGSFRAADLVDLAMMVDRDGIYRY